MPTDSLQLYNPLSLESISDALPNPFNSESYYPPFSQEDILENGHGGGHSLPILEYHAQQPGGPSADYTVSRLADWFIMTNQTV